MTKAVTMLVVRMLVVGLGLSAVAWAEPPSVAEAQRFAALANQPTGLLVPLYIYPANIHTNADYNRLIDLKKTYPRVPVWAILNPASGPGTAADANYVKAIDRLQGAGIVVLGYVSTEYGKRAAAKVLDDLETWRKFYPKTQGLFFDEMQYDDHAAAVERQVRYRAAATERGYWPIVANPGAPTPERFFAGKVADVIIVHEAAEYPTEAALKGDYFGGYADYPPWTRCVLVHSRPRFEPVEFARIKKYVRWVYVTDDIYRTPQDNPWDSLPKDLDSLFQTLNQ